MAASGEAGLTQRHLFPVNRVRRNPNTRDSDSRPHTAVTMTSALTVRTPPTLRNSVTLAARLGLPGLVCDENRRHEGFAHSKRFRRSANGNLFNRSGRAVVSVGGGGGLDGLSGGRSTSPAGVALFFRSHILINESGCRR
jgi:hypothetical protein